MKKKKTFWIKKKMFFQTFRQNVIALVILGLLLTISHAVMEFFNSVRNLIPTRYLRYLRYDIVVNFLWFLILLLLLIGMVYLMKGTTDFDVGVTAITTTTSQKKKPSMTQQPGSAAYRYQKL